MPTVYISVGSNIERERSIRFGIKALQQHFGQLVLSRVYNAVAVGFEGDDFLNLMVSFESSLSPEQISSTLDQIEQLSGRTCEQKKFNSRTLDLDLTLYGDLISDNPNLEIPRSEITRYAFVLEPLAEIAGQLKHPVTKLSYNELWQAFDKTHLAQQAIKFDW